MNPTADLPDLNVWLALSWPEHSHHQQALHYWEQQAADQGLFCSVTALGLVRLVCQPKLMGTAVKNAGQASALLDALGQQMGGVSPTAAGW
jgi:predicted nucleic acid-binding protein